MLVAALCVSTILAAAPPPTLPSGTLLTFVADDAVEARSVRPGGSYKAHLRDELILDGVVLAPAGTSVQLLVADVERNPGAVRMRIALQHFPINVAASELPVVPLTPLVDAVPAGLVIVARTVGSVVQDGDRIVVRSSLPFALSTDAPNAFFTPIPFRTTAPVVPPRRNRPSPTPSAATSVEPMASPSG